MLTTNNNYDDLLSEVSYRTFTHKRFLESVVEQETTQNFKGYPHKREEYKLGRLMEIAKLYRGISKSMAENVKQVIIIRRDQPQQKMLVKVTHAALLAVPLCDVNLLTKWYDLGMPKSIYTVKDGEEIIKFEQNVIKSKLSYYPLMDGNNNEYPLVLAIGPCFSSEINKLLTGLTVLV